MGFVTATWSHYVECNKLVFWLERSSTAQVTAVRIPNGRNLFSFLLSQKMTSEAPNSLGGQVRLKMDTRGINPIPHLYTRFDNGAFFDLF